MTEQRASANGESVFGPIFDVPSSPDTYDKALKILALARTGVAASDILDMQPGFEPIEKGQV